MKKNNRNSCKLFTEAILYSFIDKMLSATYDTLIPFMETKGHDESPILQDFHHALLTR